MVQDLCKHGIKKLQMNFSYSIHSQFRKELLKQTALNVVLVCGFFLCLLIWDQPLDYPKSHSGLCSHGSRCSQQIF